MSTQRPGTVYVTARVQFYQTFPVLVLQATNAGVRSLGYEAIFLHAPPLATSSPPFLALPP